MSDLQIEKGSGAKPRVTFYSDGVATDLDGACTATVLKPDGTQLAGSPFTASHVAPSGSGIYEFTLGQQTEVIYYDVTWAGAIGGVATSVTTRVEVVGTFLFTLDALRKVKVAGGTPFQSTTDFPNQVLLDRRAEVTDDFEAKTGWSFIPRFTREEHSGDGTNTLLVREYLPGRLLSVTVDGATQTLSAFDLTDDGKLIWQGATFPATRPGNVTIEYVRGFDRPPARISSDALIVAGSWLLPSQAGSTASTWTTPDGTSYTFDPAGRSLSGGGTAFYGIPKVDADLNNPAYTTSGGGGFS